MHGVTAALTLASAIVLAACGPTSDETARVPGQTPVAVIDHVAGYAVVCIDGVQYLRDLHAMAPRFGRDGRVLGC